ncbi:MAG: hypothetical protein IPQ19_13200 [Bacteroidetes bacterium]|nr:hypothetical protein [Bacteroidota bacterium]
MPLYITTSKLITNIKREGFNESKKLEEVHFFSNKVMVYLSIMALILSNILMLLQLSGG